MEMNMFTEKENIYEMIGEQKSGVPFPIGSSCMAQANSPYEDDDEEVMLQCNARYSLLSYRVQDSTVESECGHLVFE